MNLSGSSFTWLFCDRMCPDAETAPELAFAIPVKRLRQRSPVADYNAEKRGEPFASGKSSRLKRTLNSAAANIDPLRSQKHAFGAISFATGTTLLVGCAPLVTTRR